jgi:hypothetical protein
MAQKVCDLCPIRDGYKGSCGAMPMLYVCGFSNFMSIVVFEQQNRSVIFRSQMIEDRSERRGMSVRSPCTSRNEAVPPRPLRVGACSTCLCALVWHVVYWWGPLI